MTDRYDELRAALDAGPTEGPWFTHESLGYAVATVGTHRIAADTEPQADPRFDIGYIAAANPETIRALLEERDSLRDALTRAETWIETVPHGDNCFVSSHYEGDPGAGCNCGKQSVEAALFAALTQQEQA